MFSEQNLQSGKQNQKRQKEASKYTYIFSTDPNPNERFTKEKEVYPGTNKSM